MEKFSPNPVLRIKKKVSPNNFSTEIFREKKTTIYLILNSPPLGCLLLNLFERRVFLETYNLCLFPALQIELYLNKLYGIKRKVVNIQ